MKNVRGNFVIEGGEQLSIGRHKQQMNSVYIVILQGHGSFRGNIDSQDNRSSFFPRNGFILGEMSERPPLRLSLDRKSGYLVYFVPADAPTANESADITDSAGQPIRYDFTERDSPGTYYYAKKIPLRGDEFMDDFIED